MKAKELKIEAAWRGGTPTSIGQKLKSTTTDWPSYVNVGTNVVGFKALPAVTKGLAVLFLMLIREQPIGLLVRVSIWIKRMEE